MSELSRIRVLSTKLTQIYSEFSVRIQLINLMVMESTQTWSLFLKSYDRWLGNCVVNTAGIFPDYIKVNSLGLEFVFERVFLA